MTAEELEVHIIDLVRAAGRVDEIYPDKDNHGIVRVDVEGKKYVLTIVETVEPEDLLEP